MEKVLFNETQKYTVLLIAAILFSIFFGILYILQILFNIHLGSYAEPNWLLIIFFIASLTGVLFFSYQKLIVVITYENISINFGISGKTVILIKDIKKISVRKYDAQKEFWGWGVRYNSTESCFTVAGNNAIEIELKTNEKILIGTQKPESIQTIIDEYFSIDAPVVKF